MLTYRIANPSNKAVIRCLGGGLHSLGALVVIGDASSVEC